MLNKSGLIVSLLAAFLYSTPLPAPIIKINPNKENQNLAYKDLCCTDQDKACIYQIITMMSENGKLSLLLHQNHLKELGAQINHLHPMKFVTTIFTNPHLKLCMVDVFDDYFKRNGFMDGLAPSFEREVSRGKLHDYIDEFADELKVHPDAIRIYFHMRDWEGLVRCLMSHNGS